MPTPRSRFVDDMRIPQIRALYEPPDRGPVLQDADFDGLRLILAEHWRDVSDAESSGADPAKLRDGRWGIPSIIATTERGLAKILADFPEPEVKAAPKKHATPQAALKASGLFSKGRAKTIAATETVHASNYGALAKSCSIGPEFVRVSDGPGCGKTSHGDSDKVDGQIWHIDKAAAYPGAHPNCKRRFGALKEGGRALGRQITLEEEEAEYEAGEERGYRPTAGRTIPLSTFEGDSRYTGKAAREALWAIEEKDGSLVKMRAALRAKNPLPVDDYMDMKAISALNPRSNAKYAIDGALDFLGSLVDRAAYTNRLGWKLGVGYEIGERPYYAQDERRVVLGSGSIADAIHEIGHHLEMMFGEDGKNGYRRPPKTVIDFYRRRTKGNKLVPIGEEYGADERTKVDQWADPYLGKWYTDASGPQPLTELVSMGLQLLYEGPFELARDDPDLFDFLIAVIRGEFNQTESPRVERPLAEAPKNPGKRKLTAAEREELMRRIFNR